MLPQDVSHKKTNSFFSATPNNRIVYSIRFIFFSPRVKNTIITIHKLGTIHA